MNDFDINDNHLVGFRVLLKIYEPRRLQGLAQALLSAGRNHRNRERVKASHPLFYLHPEIVYVLSEALGSLHLHALENPHYFKPKHLLQALEALRDAEKNLKRNPWDRNFLGVVGEFRVAALLVSQGYDIYRMRHFLYPAGSDDRGEDLITEVDVVLKDKDRENEYILVEVKTSFRGGRRFTRQLELRSRLLSGEENVLLDFDGSEMMKVSQVFVYSVDINQPDLLEKKRDAFRSLQFFELPEDMQRESVYPSFR